MREHEASRTLVKSPPELWAECSEADSLGRHLNGSFGEIRITRLEPETAVAWEGERASGTVRIEPSAWGTRVILTAQVEGAEVLEETAEEAPEPGLEPRPAPESAAAEAEPELEEAEAEPEAEEAEQPEQLEPEQPEPVADMPAPAPRVGWWARVRTRLRPAPVAPEREPTPPEPVAPEPEPTPPEPVAQEPDPESAGPEPDPESAGPEPDPEPVAVEPDPEPAREPEPVATAEEAVGQEPEPVTEPELDAEQILVAALDSLGQAHHRPFSRA